MKLKNRTFTGSTSVAVTKREQENREIARRAASEGFVLLKNDGHLLPLAAKGKIGLYGAGAVKTIKGGTGSGDVNERDCVSICQGLKAAGYEVTSDAWLSSYETIYADARQAWKEEVLRKLKQYDGNFFQAYSTTPFVVPCGDSIDEEAAKADGADVAVFVLSRIAGENADRHDTEGDYFITKEEKSLLAQISASYDSVVLVINTGGLIDLAFTEEFTNIKSIVQFMQAGQEGGSAFADIMSGAVNPSGKMTDSWAYTYLDYPNARTFSHKNGNTDTEKYEEGIFVGYRYFDTFDVPVRYGFGFGLSYTEFSVVGTGVSASGLGTDQPKISVTASVKNTGNTYAGKEVAEVYVSCPQNGMPKEYRRLAGFAKTRLLSPGENQDLTITFPLYQLASYHEDRSAWILEAGTYGIWVGNSLESASLSATISLDADVVMVQCESICERKEDLKELIPDAGKMKEKEAAWKSLAESLKLPDLSVCADQIVTETVAYPEHSGVTEGKAGEIVSTLSEEQLIALATGDPGKGQENALGSAGLTVPGAAAETSSAAIESPWNVASMVLADGPAGLRLHKTYQVVDGKINKGSFLQAFEGGFFADPEEPEGTTYYQYCTALPVGTLLAQTWDVNLLKEAGEMIGREMELFNVTLWLAPGMNIHRNPLCGRNFEYYSEDPLLSGMMASAITLGVQKVPGCGTTIKHFACNNQEDNRMGSDSVLSERALREIYLKGFEIAVKNSQPMSIMTSYNQINGVHAANSYDICTKAARDEWGFAGAIMTDWTTTTASTAGVCTAAGCMRAGNDMVMPGVKEDHDNIRRELKEGTLEISALQRCICNTVNLVLQSNQYEDAVSYSSRFEKLDTYMTAE
ncbi:MAG: glycoside hydrolase family 3 C-terminal domain-containing protein [Hungatella hathewayi]|uniref:glycoside hydrolase family 3 protein n=1 Tax=Hungatella TaxID=1649459 RepID=UPI00110683D1|nr:MULTISPECIES: glycoside hydrolase family 3 protein [Hungatella]MCI7382649.1 glycoside hydrolase family 3 C-terminal domain-containing protein [Hungatella sp.]MDY6237851.1 glycoside hydrolase family 3 C-terminal domain-containing protein [Hungatella hathewayi]